MSAMNYIHTAVAGLLTACLILLNGVMMPEAYAQEVPQWSGASQGSSTVINLPSTSSPGVAGENVVISATLNKTQLINLPEPVRGIVVTNEGIADVMINQANEYQVFILPKSVGAANILFMNEDGAVINQIEVQVAMDAVELRHALKKLLPDENIEVDVHGGNIYLSGAVQSATAVDDAVRIATTFVADPALITNMLSISGSQQVIIKVRVSEMDRGTVKDLAVGLTGTYTQAGRGISFTTPTPDVTDVFVNGGATRVLRGLTNVTFDALESQSLVKTLAEPTLTARSGETASFTSGGEVPIQSGVDDNGNAIISLVEYGILLDFTPTVLDKGLISLNVSTEVSEVDTSVAVDGVPGFKTKNTETTVELPSGGSMMISGLIQQNNSNSISGFPFLKDLPLLGVLFRSTSFQNDETELVITVTAYLAEPVGNDTPLSLPTDGFEPSSDTDLYLLGRLHKEYGKGGTRPFWSELLDGPFGYIME